MLISRALRGAAGALGKPPGRPLLKPVCPRPLGPCVAAGQQPARRHLETQAPRPYVDPRLSYAFGRSNEHLLYSTVGRELDKRLEASDEGAADELAFVFHGENKSITVRQLHADVNRLTKALVKRLQIGKGDAVGVLAYNCYNWLVAQFACGRLGAVLTPLNPSYKADELAYALHAGQIKCLMMPGFKSQQRNLNDHTRHLQSAPVREAAAAANGAGLHLRHIVLMDNENHYLPAERESISAGAGLGERARVHLWRDLMSPDNNDGQIHASLDEALEAGQSEASACVLAPDSVQPDDLFAVYFTSGTTGRPKGAAVTQFNVLNNARFCQFRLRQGRPRSWPLILGTTLPLFHIFAGVLNALGPLLMRRTTVVFSSFNYDIGAFVEAIIRHRTNAITVTPTMLIDLLAHVEQRQLAGQLPLQLIQSGGAALSPEIAARTFKVLPRLGELRAGYGSTENGGVASIQSMHEPQHCKMLTVGPPMDFSEIRVCDPKTGATLPLGERGEVQTRGYNTMLGYLNQPDKTTEVITQHRWYRTGDVGLMHPHGSVQICARLKHMIIKGGENIYPEEVQQLLLKLDYVEDAHVIGVPDERFGEQVCAWIKLRPGFRATHDDRKTNAEAPTQGPATNDDDNNNEQRQLVVSRDQVVQYCKDNITYFKVPRYVLFVDEFPMTPTKKVQTHIMTERSIALLGLASDNGKQSQPEQQQQQQQ